MSVEQQYSVKIKGQEFNDIISMDGGYQYSCQSFSAESSTGQTTDGNFRVPIIGERVQLVFTCPPYITKQRLTDLVTALEIGSKGQREIAITYDDLLFGWITRKFYCVNIPWIKVKLPNYPNNYGAGVTFQLASSEFVGATIPAVSPAVPPKFNIDPDFTFKINGAEFNDIIAIEGFKGQIIDQSLESETGLTLDGKFHLPIIGSRSQITIDCIPYVEVNRFKNLGKALGFGTTGERSHMLNYIDMVKGNVNQKFYCTQISATREKLPDYPYHYAKDVKFQQAMKQFY